MASISSRRVALSLGSALASSFLAVACSGSLAGGESPSDGGSAERPDVWAPPGTDAALVPSDSGPPPSGRAPMFVAAGYAGRTTASCDDGRTWIADRSDDPGLRCFDGVDCDHHPGRSKGIVFTGTHFVATFGWGSPGGVRRSADGLRWDEVVSGTTYGGVAAGGGVVLVGGRSSRRSTDDGATWSSDIDVGLGGGWNVRRAGFSDQAGGVFVLVGNDASEMVVSTSAAPGTWGAPDTIPPECGASIQNNGGIATGNGALVILGGDGVACRSTDGGRTFSSARVSESITSHLLFDGRRFVAWSRGQRHESADGASWTAQATTPASLELGAVAHSSATGTYVGVNGGWNQWYERQTFYRSTDGVTWEALPAGAFAPSHPIFEIAFGYGAPSAECPAP